MKQAEDSVSMPIMEEAPFPSVKARPASQPTHVELASHLPAGFNGDEEEGDDDDNDEAEEEEECEIGDETSYGISSPPCCSSPCGSAHDGSLRSPFSSDNCLSCTLHDGRSCSVHCSNLGSFGFCDCGFYSCSSSSSHACAHHKHTASSCQNVGSASLCCHSILDSGGGSSMHGPDVGSLGSIDDGYMCSISPHVYADSKHPAFSYQASLGRHDGLYFSSEREEGKKHPSSCGLNDSYGCSPSSCGCNDSYGCSTSSCHNSDEEAHGFFGEGNSALNHFVHKNGSAVISVHEKDNTHTLSIHANSKDTLCIDGHGSACHCPVDPLIAQEKEDAKCGPRESLDSRRNGSKRGRELGRMFQLAVDHLDWQVAEDLIPLADKPRLNDWLCIAVDSFWFLCTHKELCNATQIMEKLVRAGADGFVRAALRTSFLASCVWACQSRTRDLNDTVNILGDRLHERLQECSGYELSSAEAVKKIKRMTEWALECIVLRCQAEMRGHVGEVCPSTPLGAQLQLRAFERFLELAENRLSGEDYTEAFEAACFPLSLFSFVLDTGWASGIAASAMQGLLGMLVEGGADNVNQCCLDAARSGSTELLRMLLQIARRNGIEVDVDVALGYASHHCKLGTMECLVDVGNAAAFLDPFIRASDRGCMPVVQWFVEKGCQDTELCWGLTAAVSSNRVEVAEYLLKHIPLPVLSALSLDIVKAAVEHSGGCLKGVAFLFQHDFLGGPEATYEVGNRVAKLEDGSVSNELKRFCKHEWSHTAFIRGRQAGADHYWNVQRVLRHGSSALQLKELPPQLQVAIAYLPLYRECAESCGLLLSQRLRGQLIEAAWRLECSSAERLMKYDKSELVALLKARLPTFFVEKY